MEIIGTKLLANPIIENIKIMDCDEVKEKGVQFEQLKPLVDLGRRIRKLGGRVEILEERFLF